MNRQPLFTVRDDPQNRWNTPRFKVEKIVAIKKNGDDEPPELRASMEEEIMRRVQKLLPTALTPTYIQSQWSFAQFRLPGSEKQPTRAIAAFGGADRGAFLVVCSDGSFFKCRFDPVKGGECVREDWQRFLFGDDDEQ